MVQDPAPEPAPEPNAVERLKVESHYLRDPLVAEFAAGGTHITDDGYQILKFHGSYQQDDRDVRNDRRKAGAEYDFGFMIRLRIAGGDVPPALWLALDDLATRFGRASIRLTTRQSVQLHFIPKGDVGTVIRTVNEALASTLGACGDVNRNVMAAPLPVADPRYAVVRDMALRVSEHLLPRTRAYAELWLDGTELARIGPADGSPIEEEPLYGKTYLPRKFKTCVTVAGDNSVDLFTHDLGLAGFFTGRRARGLERVRRRRPGADPPQARDVPAARRGPGLRPARRRARDRRGGRQGPARLGRPDEPPPRAAQVHDRGARHRLVPRRGRARVGDLARAGPRGGLGPQRRPPGLARAGRRPLVRRPAGRERPGPRRGPACGSGPPSGPSRRSSASRTASPPTRTCTSWTFRPRIAARWHRSSPTTASRRATGCAASRGSRWPARPSRPAASP